MATINHYQKVTQRERYNRYFSEAFKRNKVTEIERNLTTVSELCREYQISRTSVYNWIYKYSLMRKRGIKQVVEAKSDTRKLQEMQKYIKELEQLLGQKQIKVDFYEKMIELAEEEFGIEIKKKASTPRSGGSGSTGKNTPSK